MQSSHNQGAFNDNLDQDGTLEYVRPRTDTEPGNGPIIISQNPRYPTGLTRRSATVQTTKKHDPFKATANETSSVGTYDAVPVNGASKKVRNLQSIDLVSSGGDKQDNTSTTSSELDVAMAESDVWTYVAPLVPETYTASLQDDLEIKAFSKYLPDSIF